MGLRKGCACFFGWGLGRDARDFLVSGSTAIQAQENSAKADKIPNNTQQIAITVYLRPFRRAFGSEFSGARLTLRRGPRDARNHLKALGAREV